MGRWGGRYVKVRENTYLDPVPVEDINIRKDVGTVKMVGDVVAYGQAVRQLKRNAVFISSRCGVGAKLCRTILQHVPTGV